MGWREQVALVQGTAVRTFAADGDASETFIYTATGFPPVTVLGVFRDAHTYVDARTTVQVSTVQPTLDLMRADLPREPRTNDTVESVVPRFQGRIWRVSDSQHDGEGIYKLFLIQTQGPTPP